jgi:hypothetical protein
MHALPSNTYLMDITGAAPSSCYSVRRLSSSYMGYAMKVRRSSDNTEQDIAFDFNGTVSTAQLLAFVGSGDGFVTVWYDQSGNGAHLTQSTAAYQPKIVIAGVVQTENNRPFIRFYGTSNSSTYNYLSLAAAKTVNAQIIAVNKFAGTDGFILGHDNYYYWHSNPNISLINSQYNTNIYNGTFYQNGISKTGATAIWNTSLLINSIAPVNPSSSTDWNNIGRDRTFHPITSGGGYAELLQFNSAITTTQRVAIERNQGSYFTLTVP